MSRRCRDPLVFPKVIGELQTEHPRLAVDAQYVTQRAEIVRAADAVCLVGHVIHKGSDIERVAADAAETGTQVEEIVSGNPGGLVDRSHPPRTNDQCRYR